jgi:hypothetical protein
MSQILTIGLSEDKPIKHIRFETFVEFMPQVTERKKAEVLSEISLVQEKIIEARELHLIESDLRVTNTLF